MIRIALPAALLAAPFSILTAQSSPASAIAFRAVADRWLELNAEVIQPATSLVNSTHRRDAHRALAALTDFEQSLPGRFAGLMLDIDDEIDSTLIALQMAEARDDLMASLEDEDSIRVLLPAAGLMEDLPDLTGLLEPGAFEVGLAALTQARGGIPAPWEPLPGTPRLQLLRAASARARNMAMQVEQWLGRARNRFAGRADTADLVEAAGAVRRGLQTWADEVTNTALPRLEATEAAWGSPIGRERFLTLLVSRHQIHESPDELLAWGRAQLDSVQREVAVVARRIDRRSTPEQVWERLKNDHPTADSLPLFAYREMERSLDFLLDRGAVTIPANARRNVMLLAEGSTFDTYPFGGYGGNAQEGAELVGRFLTSPPRAGMDSAAALERLRGNNYYWARVVAVHEMYPGHHLQSVHGQLSPRPMRRNFYTTTMGEGWGLYSEQMMYRLGFFEDDATVMAMLMMRAWRASRVIIDVSLHLGLMSMDEAVLFLVDNVAMDRENALAEVRRYIGNPTRPLSYLYGYDLIEKLRRDYMRVRGAEFTERDFHDRFLSYGPIPITLIRYGMLGERP